LGQDEFEIKAEVKDEKDFFEQMSFYSNLPKAAPNGATDLKLVFRTTKQGHKYYSLISEIEKMEFKFGQNLENKGNGLFPKGWETAYGVDKEDEVQTSGIGIGAPAQQPNVGNQQPNLGNVGIGGTLQAQQPAAQPAAAPAPAAFKMPTPVSQPAAVQQAPAAAPTAFTLPPTQTQVAQPTAAPVVSANPQVAAVAADVLKRFGLATKTT
jgi:hypothetical protein